MICREKPKNVDNCYIVHNKDLVHHLMNKGVYPLYFYDNVYYFIKDDKCNMYMSEWQQNLGERR